MIEEMEALKKEEEKSVRLRELFEQRRVNGTKKRKVADCHVWKREVEREIKKVRKEDAEAKLKEQTEAEKKRRQGEKEMAEDADEMGRAVRWAMTKMRENGDWG